jgi:hypothetical protein
MMLAGILALDVGLVAGLASLHARKQRRVRREIEQLETLWRLRPGPATRSSVSSPSMRNRFAIVGVLVALVGAGTAYAHPVTRDLVGSMVETVVGGRDVAAPMQAAPLGQRSDAGRSIVRIGSDAPVGVAEGRRTVGPDPTLSQSTSVDERVHDAPRPPIVGPATPATLVAVAASSTTIVLTWTDVAAETGYRIDRSPDGRTEWVTIATVAPDVTVHSDAALPAGVTFYYRIAATGVGVASPPSGVASATTDLVLLSPSTVTAVAVSSSVIELAWTDVAAENGYRIERSDDGTGWTVIATTGQDVTTFSDTALPAGTTFAYRVVATNAGGESLPSSVATATTGMEAERPVPTPEPPASEQPSSEQPSSEQPSSEARTAA